MSEETQKIPVNFEDIEALVHKAITLGALAPANLVPLDEKGRNILEKRGI
jgi:hypothetical protein